ncbi:MAG: GNAT family N-acetyltransferase [Thermoplasmata archaeon]
MTIAIRAAQSRDLPHIAAHYGTGDTPWDPFGDPEKLERLPPKGLVVAEVGGQYAGFLYWFEAREPWFDPGIGRYARIEEVQVVSGHRGRGVGRDLLSHALDQMTREKVEAVYVDTTEENAVARRLYEGAGFRVFSRTLHYRLG